MKNHPIDKGKETWKELQQIASYGYDASSVYSDFLDICLYGILSLTHNMQYLDVVDRLKDNKLTGLYEEEYLKMVKKYRENETIEKGKRPIDYFHRAWWALQAETKALEHDVLGEIFMTQISHGEHGQFFTPNHLCDMMAQITLGDYKEGKTLNDPACGSGRFFISASKVRKDLKYVGNDISMNCVKMAVLNMWMFNLEADIYLGNTLSMKMDRLYSVRPGGWIWEKSL